MWDNLKGTVTFKDLKEMEYGANLGEPVPEFEILCQAWYKGYKVLIVSYFTHPCAYIGLPSDHKYNGAFYGNIGGIKCHGGLTYSSDCHSLISEMQNQGWFIGWDYAHYGDYILSPESRGKKWTTMEIIKECISVVDQLEEAQSKVKEEPK